MPLSTGGLEALRAVARSLKGSQEKALSSDGKILTLNGVEYDATVTCDATDDADGTGYSLGSLYLVCVYPALMPRRKASNAHKVENVKATHVDRVLAFLGGTSGGGDGDGGDAGAAADVAPTDDDDFGAVGSAEPTTNKDGVAETDDAADVGDAAESSADRHRRHKDAKRKRSSGGKDHNHRGGGSSSKHHKNSKHHKDRHHQKRPAPSSSSSVKPKEKTPITNEQVMQNLSSLNDKQAERLKRKEERPEALITTNATTGNDAADNNKNDADAEPSNDVDGATTATATVEPTTTATTITQDKSDEDKIDGKNATKLLFSSSSSTTNNNNNNNTSSASKTTPSSSARSASLSSVHNHNDENDNKASVSEALSADVFHFSKEDVDADREATERITANETPVGNSASVLRFTSDKDSFSRVLRAYREVRDRESRRSSGGGSSGSGKHHGGGSSGGRSSSGHGRSGHSQRRWDAPSSSNGRSSSSSRKDGSSSSSHRSARRRRPDKPPLIIVPNAMTAPIGLVNARDFFHGKRYVPREEARRRGDGARPTPFTFKRRLPARLVGAGNGGSELEYEVMDDPRRLPREEWDRIVAVVPLGEAWQFKNWRWQRPTEIFDRCLGFWIGMEGAPLPKDLAGWNVRRARLNQDKRGLDSVAHADFWNSLDEWMVLHKREYLPNYAADANL